MDKSEVVKMVDWLANEDESVQLAIRYVELITEVAESDELEKARTAALNHCIGHGHAELLHTYAEKWNIPVSDGDIHALVLNMYCEGSQNINDADFEALSSLCVQAPRRITMAISAMSKQKDVVSSDDIDVLLQSVRVTQEIQCIAEA